MVVFGEKWLYSGKSGSNRPKVVAFEQSGCIWEGVFVFGQVVVFGQKRLYSGKSGCIRGIWL